MASFVKRRIKRSMDNVTQQAIVDGLGMIIDDLNGRPVRAKSGISSSRHEYVYIALTTFLLVVLSYTLGRVW